MSCSGYTDCKTCVDHIQRCNWNFQAKTCHGHPLGTTWVEVPKCTTPLETLGTILIVLGILLLVSGIVAVAILCSPPIRRKRKERKEQLRAEAEAAKAKSAGSPSDRATNDIFAGQAQKT